MTPRNLKHSPKVKPELTAVELSTLRALADGGHISAHRTFPHPHRFTLHRAGFLGTTPTLAAGVVATLVERHLVDAHPLDSRKDRISYTVTAEGRRVASGDVVPVESGQLDAFPEAP